MFNQEVPIAMRLKMDAHQAPKKSKVENVLEDITSDVLLPLMRLNDKGERVRLVHEDWELIRSHVKQQVAEIYFGTHKRLENIDFI
jgi:hypothetical protein